MDSEEKDEPTLEADDYHVVILHGDSQFWLAEAICENIRNIDIGNQTPLRVDILGNILRPGQQETNAFDDVIENTSILMFFRSHEFFADSLNGFAVSAAIEDRVRHDDPRRHWTLIPLDIEKKTKLKGKIMINSMIGMTVSIDGSLDETKTKNLLRKHLRGPIQTGRTDEAESRSLAEAQSRQVKDISSLMPSPDSHEDTRSTSQRMDSGQSTLGCHLSASVSSPAMNSNRLDPNSQGSPSEPGCQSKTPVFFSLPNLRASENSTQNAGVFETGGLEREDRAEKTTPGRQRSRGQRTATSGPTADDTEPAATPSPSTDPTADRSGIYARQTSSDLTTAVELDNPGSLTSHPATHQRPREGNGFYDSGESETRARQREPGCHQQLQRSQESTQSYPFQPPFSRQTPAQQPQQPLQNELFQQQFGHQRPTQQPQQPLQNEWFQQQFSHQSPTQQPQQPLQNEWFQQQFSHQRPTQQPQQNPLTVQDQNYWNKKGARPKTYHTSQTTASPPGHSAPDPAARKVPTSLGVPPARAKEPTSCGGASESCPEPTGAPNFTDDLLNAMQGLRQVSLTPPLSGEPVTADRFCASVDRQSQQLHQRGLLQDGPASESMMQQQSCVTSSSELQQQERHLQQQQQQRGQDVQSDCAVSNSTGQWQQQQVQQQRQQQQEREQDVQSQQHRQQQQQQQLHQHQQHQHQQQLQDEEPPSEGFAELPADLPLPPRQSPDGIFRSDGTDSGRGTI